MKRLPVYLVMAVFLVSTFAFVTGCSTLTGRTAGETVDDSRITAVINEKIIKDPDLHYLKINVDTFEGHVTLTGTVPSKDAENKLIGYAKNTQGVKDVKTNLVIKP